MDFIINSGTSVTRSSLPFVQPSCAYRMGEWTTVSVLYCMLLIVSKGLELLHTGLHIVIYDLGIQCMCIGTVLVLIHCIEY